MNSALRRRLAVLLTAVAALLLLVGLLAHATWSQSVAVRDHFRIIQDESADLAAHFRDSVQSIDAFLFRFKLHGGTAERRQLDDLLDRLDHWLDLQRSRFVTTGEVAQFRRIDAALDGYMAAARRFADSRETGAALAAQLATCQQTSETLMGLGFELATAHNATAEASLARAARSLSRIQWVTFAALGLLAVAGSAIGWLVYRDHIAPLRLRLDESLRQLERQEKLAALGTLSAGIAHEIRNPLAALKARLFTLRKAVAADASATEDAVMIGAEIERLDRIVRAFLQFARPPEPVLGPILPTDLLARAVALADPAWSARGIQLFVEPVDAPAVTADAEQIAQALLNLLRNAAEALAAGGGEIRLSACTGATTPDGRPAVAFSVADNGPGIAAEVRGRLFDPFFTTKPGGTGLGLALSARLLEKHGGAIHCASSPGRGATFTLTLPVAKP
jgi:signal transduction histidine kinase